MNLESNTMKKANNRKFKTHFAIPLSELKMFFFVGGGGLQIYGRKKRRGRKSSSSSTLQPREQKVKESRRVRWQMRQVLVTPLPGLGWGLSFKNTILALFIMYVWTPLMSRNFWISETLTTSWYDDLLICNRQTHLHNAENQIRARPPKFPVIIGKP